MSVEHDRPADQPPHGDDQTLSTTGETSPPPSRAAGLPTEIGGYRIFGRLGEGGMGVVYEAEQPSPRRRVALKVLRGAEQVDDLRLKMFEREAATLARLDHPNIGAIYESGHTAEGRAFFAMELVRGVTLKQWLARRTDRPDRAEIELRLSLFRQISDAVHYAHQRGVIHRDLKPSNLIVLDAQTTDTGSGVPPSPMVKVLDFGLARITEEEFAVTQVTEVGVIKGTLPYMAPEQARGEAAAADVRTDVYALGVVLYELLTGQRPYSVDTGSLLSAVRVICEQEPKPLAEAWRATYKLDPDLATIVSTALQKEPDSRFASAAAFGDDVGRFLASQPILARSPSTIYQIRKLVARRKPVFATAAAALVLLIVAAVGLSVLYVRSERNLLRAVAAEQDARREAETAQRTSEFMVDLFDRANPERNRGETVTAREVVDEGAFSIDENLTGEPVMQSRLMFTISQVYSSLGLYDSAKRLAERSLALREEHLPAGHLDIAMSEKHLAHVLDSMGDRTGARARYEDAIRHFEALGDEGLTGLSAAQGELAWMLGNVGDFENAHTAIERALTIERSRQPLDEARVRNLLTNQGTILRAEGKLDSAQAVLGRALTIARRIHGEDHQSTADVLTNLGTAQANAGQFESSAASYLEALRIYRKIYGDNHPKAVRALGNVGIGFAERGKFAEGRPYFEQALEAGIAIYGMDSPMLGQMHMNLGLLNLQSGASAGAITHLERAVVLNERAAPDGVSISLSTTLYHLASARAAVGDLPEARALMQRVVDMDEKIFGPESRDVADDLEALVELDRLLGRTTEADRNEQRMNAIREKLGVMAAGSG